jgi:phage repressor protein C with HTH and peptisase S24 domain
MENIGQRIKQLRKMLRLSQREFGEKIGRALNTVQKWEMGQRTPDESTLKLIAKEFNVNEEWLKTGKGEMFAEGVIKEGEAIKIPYYPETNLSAGTGIEPYSEQNRWIEISEEFMVELFGRVYKRGLALFPVYGNSMEPTIPAGSVAIIRLYEFEQSIINGSIYALSIDNDIYIKRIKLNPITKKLTLISDNPDYEPIEVPEEFQERIKIIGRFLGIIRGVS